MLRCSRLAGRDLKLMERSKDTEANESYNYGFKSGILAAEAVSVIRIGDNMTGWEIIASLPLEIQKEHNLVWKEIRTKIGYPFNLCGIYEYTGNTEHPWKEVKE